MTTRNQSSKLKSPATDRPRHNFSSNPVTGDQFSPVYLSKNHHSYVSNPIYSPRYNWCPMNCLIHFFLYPNKVDSANISKGQKIPNAGSLDYHLLHKLNIIYVLNLTFTEWGLISTSTHVSQPYLVQSTPLPCPCPLLDTFIVHCNTVLLWSSVPTVIGLVSFTYHIAKAFHSWSI